MQNKRRIHQIFKMQRRKSFAPKHQKMKNAKDFHKIKSGEYGVINFNKMLPVKEECIIEFDFKNEKDKNYRLLLQNQYKEIISLEGVIKKKAENIYKIFHAKSSELTQADLAVKNRCCDFDLLEKMCDEYSAATSDCAFLR